MTVEIKPETERLVAEEIREGRVHSVDELIVHGINALRQGFDVVHADTAHSIEAGRRKSLYELLTQYPFHGSELNLERRDEDPRAVDL
jgi:hypothetical protein